MSESVTLWWAGDNMQTGTVNEMRDVLAKALEQARQLGATAAKAGFHSTETTNYEFEAGRLKTTGDQQKQGYSITVLVENRSARVSSNRVEQVQTMVEEALTLAKHGSDAHFDAFPAPADTQQVEKWSKNTVQLTREQMIQGCQAIVDQLKEYDAEQMICAGATKSESQNLLLTSGGVENESRRTSWSLGAYVQRTRGTDMLFAHHGRSWCDMNDFWDPDAFADRIITDVKNADETVEAPSGKVKAYLPPEMLTSFLYPVIVGINGRNAAKGDSPLTGRIGERILAPCFTVTDEPHIDFAPSSAEMDDSGIPTQRHLIFDEGILKMFLYDLDSAGLAKTKPTGNNGSRPYNLVVAPGTRPSAELIAGIDEGLFVRNLTGFHTCNHRNGDFSCDLGLGYWIRNGEIVGRVKNTMVAGNIYDLLNGNIELSSDLDYRGFTPHAVIEGVSISS